MDDTPSWANKVFLIDNGINGLPHINKQKLSIGFYVVIGFNTVCADSDEKQIAYWNGNSWKLIGSDMNVKDSDDVIVITEIIILN